MKKKSKWSKKTTSPRRLPGYGPGLFTIFINELELNVENNLLKFSDDSKHWGIVDGARDRASGQKDLWFGVNCSRLNCTVIKARV